MPNLRHPLHSLRSSLPPLLLLSLLLALPCPPARAQSNACLEGSRAKDPFVTIQLLGKCLEQGNLPDDLVVNTLLLRGEAAVRIQLYDQAMADYDWAIRIDPVNHTAFGLRGIAHQLMGDHPAAIRDLTRALELTEDVELRAVRAECYMELEMYSLAVRDLDMVIHHNPQDVDSHIDRGDAQARIGNYDEAYEDYSTAIQLAEHPLAYDHRGHLLYHTQNYALALEDFSTAVGLAPDNGQFHGDRAFALKALGRNAEAVSETATALRLDPGAMVPEFP